MRLMSGILAFSLLAGGIAKAQAIDPNPALNNPDKLSWELFAAVNKPVPNIANAVTFETWASNEDTFQPNPKFPGASQPPSCGSPQIAAATVAAITPVASPKILNVPALVALAPRRRDIRLQSIPFEVDNKPSEEVRRNKATFEFLICNKLQTRAGLRVAFASGQPISFPIDSIEVKANWIPAGTRSPSDYYISTAADGKRYALLSMHIISKQIPNWTWATFEHQDNPGRCDFIGCHDKFGAVVQSVPPQPSSGGRYNPCTKTPAAKKVMSDAGLAALWTNYCLKGSQADFVTATGVPTRLGNSVTEDGFVDTSSCLTCHGRAAVMANGQDAYGAGFIDPPDPAVCPGGMDANCSPNGAPTPALFWSNLGKPNQSLLALQTDFIWSMPLRAIGP